jgi:hypothetical protein
VPCRAGGPLSCPGKRCGDRSEDRAGLRDLDRAVERLPGLTRLQRNRERIFPVNTVAELGHPRMLRDLPNAQTVRAPFPSRQKKARSKTRIEVLTRTASTVRKAQKELLTQPGQWRHLNDALSASAGDIQALPEKDQETLRRVDRAIQGYERANDRGHVIFTNVVMPYHVNHTSLEPYADAHFLPGDVVEFDRYTVGSHQLHETTRYAGRQATERVVAFEISTRRGHYLGRSDSMDNTTHLLPRGMQLEVVGTQKVTWRAPDGTTGTRVVVQLRDVTPDPARTAKEQR